MPNFFCELRKCILCGRNSEIELRKFYLHAHVLHFYMANWLSIIWRNFYKTCQ